MRKLLLPTILVLTTLCMGYSQSQDKAVTFAPIDPSKSLQAKKISKRLTVDGKLTEEEWKTADSIDNFFEVQPIQGARANPTTKVKVLFDDRYLYIGSFNYDSLGRIGIRVPDLRRDFDFFTNDLFGVNIDPFLDKRNAVAFQTNPHGAQRDLLCFDDQFFDREWDALWKVRTSRTDSGWVAEMAIPWKTLRYPKINTEWGINFMRRARRSNQSSTWNPYPRATNNYRMSYAGKITGLEPPPQSANIRINPFFLLDGNSKRVNDVSESSSIEPKLGGEIKWAINPHTVLDLTFNTDFAQADVDRQVNNLTRFSVFFPERRQFFLENASLFNVGLSESIQPFFSRKIGLDPAGNPIPLDAGVRLVSRDQNRNFGGMIVRQRANAGFPAATYAIGRYSKNFGNQSRVGGIITSKLQDAQDTVAATQNFTYTGDAFFRFSDALTWNVVGSASTTTNKDNGYSAVSQLEYSSNQWSLYYWQTLVDKNYDPQVGFIYDRNIINTDFGGYRIIRKAWVPKPFRQVDPGFYYHMFHRASDGKLLQIELEAFPLYFVFLSGAFAHFFVIPTWQFLPEDISIVGIPIAVGDYHYTRYRFNYGNDQSKKFAYSLRYETGGYYNGKLDSWSASARYSPLPQIALSVNYQHNEFSELGDQKTNKTTDLITPEMRLALNPRLQLISFYQYNSAVNWGVLNTRLSWEYQPLSFVYFVYNDSRQDVFNSVTQFTDRTQNQSSIFKLTFMKQF